MDAEAWTASSDLIIHKWKKHRERRKPECRQDSDCDKKTGMEHGCYGPGTGNTADAIM